jgi:hypothetical protein
MNLFEEFKAYENLWEATEAPKAIPVKQRGKTWDLSKEEDFRTIANQFAASKAKEVKLSKKSGLMSAPELAAYEDKQRVLIARGLLSTVKSHTTDSQVIKQAEAIVKEFETTYNTKHKDEIRKRMDQNFGA